MNKEIAMQLYVEELTEVRTLNDIYLCAAPSHCVLISPHQMVKEIPQTKEVTDFLESISPFLPEMAENKLEGEGEEDEEEEEEEEEERRGEGREKYHSVVLSSIV